MVRPAYRILFVGIAVVLLSLLYFLFPASQFHFYPKCIFYSLTGLYCPGCGSQRAISALLHGHLLQAVGYNLLMVVSIPFILYSAFVFCWNAFSERKMRQALFYSPTFVWIVFAFVLLFAVLRNMPWAPFRWLAP